MRRLWLLIRHFCWKRGLIRLPGRPGWEALVREVAGVALWQDDEQKLVGLPLEFTLLERGAGGGRVVPTPGLACSWSGVPVSGTIGSKPDGEPDLSSWGVRCARCGVPIHSRHAGMRVGNDIPSCPPCRKDVKRVVKE